MHCAKKKKKKRSPVVLYVFPLLLFRYSHISSVFTLSAHPPHLVRQAVESTALWQSIFPETSLSWIRLHTIRIHTIPANIWGIPDPEPEIDAGLLLLDTKALTECKWTESITAVCVLLTAMDFEFSILPHLLIIDKRTIDVTDVDCPLTASHFK